MVPLSFEIFVIVAKVATLIAIAHSLWLTLFKDGRE
jgi:hypothetical protein